MKKRKIIKYLSYTTKISLLFILISIWISAAFPKKINFLDDIRLYFQSKLLVLASDYNSQSESKEITKELNFLKENLEPWDLIFTHKKWYEISNTLIPWKRTHSMMYIWDKQEIFNFLWDNYSWIDLDEYYENNNNILIIESDKNWVGIKNIEHIKHLDAILWIRVNTTKNQKIKLFENVIKNLWKEYDFDFDIEYDNAIFCSELIYNWLKSIEINLPTTDIIIREYISPNDMVKYITNTWVSNKEFDFVVFLDNIQEKTEYKNFSDLIQQLLNQ